MRQELKLAFSGRNWRLAFGIMLACFFGMSEWVVSVDWGDEFRASALHLSIMGIFFGGAMLLMPFCACLPYVTSQVDDILYGFLDLKLTRPITFVFPMRRAAPQPIGLWLTLSRKRIIRLQFGMMLLALKAQWVL